MLQLVRSLSALQAEILALSAVATWMRALAQRRLNSQSADDDEMNKNSNLTKRQKHFSLFQVLASRCLGVLLTRAFSEIALLAWPDRARLCGGR
jgi:hypothetical protein